MSDIIAAIATGRAPCAIGILRLSGPGCAALTGRVFTPKQPFADAPDRRLVLGLLHDRQGRVIDECLGVVCRAPAPATPARRPLSAVPWLARHAGRRAGGTAGRRGAAGGTGEFTRRAFLNGKLDLTQAEAVVDLIDAETADAAANAAGQLGGALKRAIEPVYDGLTDLCSPFPRRARLSGRGHRGLRRGGTEPSAGPRGRGPCGSCLRPTKRAATCGRACAPCCSASRTRANRRC